MKMTKNQKRKRIHMRIRKKITGTATQPRLNIFRSNRYIYAQLVNDLTGSTLVQANSLETGIENTGNKSLQSNATGKLLAERAKAAGVENVLFDRGGYLYHGRVKALAEGAREGGLVF